MADRECPECGKVLKIRVERIDVLVDKPPIASPRWECEACGWSRSWTGPDED